ncbi:MAG: hypothetical protein LBR77_00935 [Lachnospiraceae bacterium]|jgi:hypothetical protein|nr:hypothetical protein [Lachnospiraceae bacterium]
MDRTFAIYDTDGVYATRFAAYANQSGKLPPQFSGVAFTDWGKVMEYGMGREIEILALGSLPEAVCGAIGYRQKDGRGDMGGHTKDIWGDMRPPGLVVSLGDGTEDARFPKVCKYQPCETVLSEIMSLYSDGEEPPVAGGGGMSSARFVGVYSPINACMKTSFALALGQALAKRRRTVFLTLEEYSGLTGMLRGCPCESAGTLSDLLYYYQQGRMGAARVASLTGNLNGLDVILPAANPEDLAATDSRELSQMLRALTKEAAYEAAVIDIGHLGRVALPLLELCDEIYMPVREDAVSCEKIREFEEYLETADAVDVAGRMVRFSPPAQVFAGPLHTYAEWLMFSELGDMARAFAEGQRVRM